MKAKLAAAALVAGLVSSTAMAADLPSRRVAPAPVVAAAPVFTWTGAYIGLQAGYAWDKLSFENNNLLGANWWGNPSVTRGGFIGGAHIGYLFQPFASPLVLGLEGDVEGATVFNGGLRASIRGRAGLAMDRALLYVTGGVAFANFRYTTVGAPFWWSTNTYSKTQTGWTIGGGLEYALTNNWSTRIEYRYADFGRLNTGWLGDNIRRTEHAVRVGVSYRFNTGYAGPVVAKY